MWCQDNHAFLNLTNPKLPNSINLSHYNFHFSSLISYHDFVDQYLFVFYKLICIYSKRKWQVINWNIKLSSHYHHHHLILRNGCWGFRLRTLYIKVGTVLTIVICYHQVRNTGSWMEIGNSISHFGIVSAQVVFVLLLFALTNVYTKDIQGNFTLESSQKAM